MPKTSLALLSCTVLWILFLTKFLYPALGKTGSSFHAADRYTHLGDSWSGFLHNLFTDPARMFNSMQPTDSIIYVLIVFAPFALLLRKSDPAIILSTAPLLASNILSSNYSQKTLIHHYSLPIVLLLLIATITKGNLQDFYSKGKSRFHLLWISILWIILAKPGYFASTYLNRTEMIEPLNNAKELIQSSDKLITSSYLAPHFSGREYIKFPRESENINQLLKTYDTILLNPKKPGWGSKKEIQVDIINSALKENWRCKILDGVFNLCIKPK